MLNRSRVARVELAAEDRAHEAQQLAPSDGIEAFAEGGEAKLTSLDVWRSLVQLVLGTYMVWDARRLRLSERHFEAGGGGGVPTADARGDQLPQWPTHGSVPTA